MENASSAVAPAIPATGAGPVTAVTNSPTISQPAVPGHIDTTAGEPSSPKQKTPFGKMKRLFKPALLVLLGVVVLGAVGLAAFLFVINPFRSPERVRVTNLTDRSVTISWVTEEKTAGAVLYATDDSFKPWLLAALGEEMAFDDRDASAAEIKQVTGAKESDPDGNGVDLSAVESEVVTEMGWYYVHHVTISGLDPETTYYFRVGDGLRFVDPAELVSESFSIQSDDSFTTLPMLEDLQVPIPSYGTIKSGAGTVDDAIVYMNPLPGTGVLPLSGMANESGGWYIDLSSLRTPAGQIMPVENSEEYTEVLYVEAGALGVSDEVEIPMTEDSPARELWVRNEDESEDVSSSSPGTSGLVSKAYAQSPGSCTESDPCTVSPVYMKDLPGDTVNSVYPDADFPTLEAALTATADRESWLKLLPVPEEFKNNATRFIDNSISHVLLLDNGSGKASREINQSVHLIGEVDAVSPYHKPTISLVRYCETTQQRPPHPGINATPEQLAAYLKEVMKIPCGGFRYVEMGVNDISALHFVNSKNSSIEGLYIGQMMQQTASTDPRPKSYYDDPNNMIGAIVIENSHVDIKDCNADSGRNTDLVENQMTSSWDDVEFNRVSFVVYNNSSGTVERNNILGFWAGGVLAKNGSDVTVKNNQMSTGGRWFCVAGLNSDIKMYNNAFYAINSQRFMGQPCGVPGVDPNHCGVDGVKADYPTWIGPIPLWHYPVYGVWMQGGSIVMENNLVGEHQTTVLLNNVTSGTIKDNIFIVTYGQTPENGVTVQSGSGGVSVSNNTKIQGYQGMLDNLDFQSCSEDPSASTVGGANVAGVSYLPICYALPKSGSVIEENKSGPIYGAYAVDWQDQEIHYLDNGCTAIPPRVPGYDCAEGLVCSSTYGSCTKPGEENSPPNTGRPCHFEQNEDGEWHCISDSTPAVQEQVSAAPNVTAVRNGSSISISVGGPRPIPVTPPASSGLLDAVGELVARILPSKVFAAENYTVTDDYVISPQADGVYDIEIPGKGSSENVVLLEEGQYTFYIDSNGNGVWDEGEEQIVVEGQTVELIVDDELTTVAFELSPGYNFVSLSTLPDEADSCQLILNLNQTSDGTISKLGRFESGRFEVTSYNAETESPVVGDCFPVVPGRGYVVFTPDATTSTYAGYDLVEPAPVSFDSAGWHLIGVNGGAKSYTAVTLIDSIDSEGTINVDNVTEWSRAASRYSGVQKTDDVVYGFDFPINVDRGYFVLVKEGQGTWVPE